jgi:hypothetical protein
MRFILILLCLFFHIAGHAQDDLLVSGYVVDSLSGEALPYVTIVCNESNVGTVSDEQGYFELRVLNLQHTLQFRYMGYSTKTISAGASHQIHRFVLSAQKVVLDAIVIRPDDVWIHDLLSKCKKKKYPDVHTSKAYFQLETSVDDEIVELIESYYNADIEGYDLKDLKIKNGRLGLKFMNGRAYLSGESSRAMQLFSFFDRNEYFPQTPLNTKSSQIRKHFSIEVVRRYHDENNREVVVMNFNPKVELKKCFSGKIWIDVAAECVLRMDVHIADAEIYPFMSLWEEDSIAKVGMDISRSFHLVNESPVFDHLDFNYTLNYKSRGAIDYIVRSKALLHFYDSEDPFKLPYFKFRKDRMGDYRNINAIPPQPEFWQDSSQFRMEINRKRNDLFFSDSTVFSHDDLFRFNRKEKKGLYENPYMHWNGNRIRLREYIPDSTNMDPRYPQFPRDQYKLSVQLFLDEIEIGDSLQFVTSTVFDPYESYYNLPSDQKAQCFINMYFDLAESWRRMLLEELKGVSSRIEVDRIYRRIVDSWNEEAEIFISEVSRGENETAMNKWNKTLIDRVGIDNLQFFKLYEVTSP